MGKGQFLQFRPNPADAQAVGDGGVNLQGFTGDATALFRGHDAQGAHVMEPVSKLDEDDPDVLGHRQQHLLQIGRLVLGLGGEVEAGQLADPIHQFGDLLVKEGRHRLAGVTGILDDVVQDGRHQAFVIHAHPSQDAGHRHRMLDVGLTAFPHLAGMGLGAELIGAVDLTNLFRGQVGFEIDAEVFDLEARLFHRRQFGDRGQRGGYQGLAHRLRACRAQAPMAW